MRAVGVKSYSAALWKFQLTSSRFLPRLAVSHGGAKLIELRSPRHGDSRTPVRPNIAAVRYDRDSGSRHATGPAVADTAHRADQINVQVSRACRQASVRSASLLSPGPPEPFLTCGLDAQNLTSGRRLSQLAPKFLILEVIGLGKSEPIFIPASCSQDVMRSARRSGKGKLPSRMARTSPLTLRAGSGGFQHSPLRHFSLCHEAPSAISSLRASATIVIRRIRPRSFPTRARNQPLSALPR